MRPSCSLAPPWALGSESNGRAAAPGKENGAQEHPHTPTLGQGSADSRKAGAGWACCIGGGLTQVVWGPLLRGLQWGLSWDQLSLPCVSQPGDLVISAGELFFSRCCSPDLWTEAVVDTQQGP